MRVAREISEHGLRPSERALGEDEPARLPHGREERREGFGAGEMGEDAEELEPSGGMRGGDPPGSGADLDEGDRDLFHLRSLLFAQVGKVEKIVGKVEKNSFGFRGITRALAPPVADPRLPEIRCPPPPQCRLQDLQTRSWHQCCIMPERAPGIGALFKRSARKQKNVPKRAYRYALASAPDVIWRGDCPDPARSAIGDPRRSPPESGTPVS